MSPSDMAEVERVRKSVARGLVTVARLNVAAKMGSEVAKAAGGVSDPVYDYVGDKKHRRVCLALLPESVQRELACRWAESVLDVFERDPSGNKKLRMALAAFLDFCLAPSGEAEVRATLAHEEALASVSLYRGNPERPCVLSEPARFSALALIWASEPRASLVAKLRPDSTDQERDLMVPLAVDSVSRAVANCFAEVAGIKTGVTPPADFVASLVTYVDGVLFDPYKDSEWKPIWDAAWSAAYRKSVDQHREDVIRELLTDRDNARA